MIFKDQEDSEDTEGKESQATLTRCHILLVAILTMIPVVFFLRN